MSQAVRIQFLLAVKYKKHHKDFQSKIFLKNAIGNFTDPFNCYCDPCHLAWLCRDNRNLLSHVFGAKCYGTGVGNDNVFFEQISPDYFTNCPQRPSHISYDVKISEETFAVWTYKK